MEARLLNLVLQATKPELRSGASQYPTSYPLNSKILAVRAWTVRTDQTTKRKRPAPKVELKWRILSREPVISSIPLRTTLVELCLLLHTNLAQARKDASQN